MEKVGGFLTGHHKKPFHEFPELELVEENIGIICESWGHRCCHYLVGHLGVSWQVNNPNFDAVCNAMPERK